MRAEQARHPVILKSRIFPLRFFASSLFAVFAFKCFFNAETAKSFRKERKESLCHLFDLCQRLNLFIPVGQNPHFKVRLKSSPE
jgi:hypothetical protein